MDPPSEIHASKEIDDAEKELENAITEEVKKYPFKEGINNTGAVIGNLFTLILEGGAFMTYVDIIKGYLDKIYLKESLDFERGRDPKDAMGIGNVMGRRFKDKILYRSPSGGNFGLIWFKNPKDGNIYIYNLNRNDWRATKVRKNEDIPDDLIEGVPHIGWDRKIGDHNNYSWDKFINKLEWPNLKESYNFERGRDPKDAMGIGKSHEYPYYYTFLKIHKMAEESKNFLDVSPIYDDEKNPYFTIISKISRKGEDGNESFEITLKKNYIECIDMRDNSTEEISDENKFAKATKCFGEDKLVTEVANFERGADPKKTMDVGLAHKYGKYYDLFVICHNLSTNSENFTYVSDIIFYKDHQPYFNIESVFFYTDEKDNKISEQFVITLWPEEILCLNVVTKDEDEFKTEKKFMKLTTCWDEPEEGWDRYYES